MHRFALLWWVYWSGFDLDGLGNACDNCPADPNGAQSDSVGDGMGDACDPDFCPADLDFDSTVGITDLLGLLAAWGPNPGHPADLDGKGAVGITDLMEMLAAWGQCP